MANCFGNIFGILTNRTPKKKVWPTEVRLLRFYKVKFPSCLSEQAEFRKGVEKLSFYWLFWQQCASVQAISLYFCWSYKHGSVHAFPNIWLFLFLLGFEEKYNKSQFWNFAAKSNIQILTNIALKNRDCAIFNTIFWKLLVMRDQSQNYVLAPIFR